MNKKKTKLICSYEINGGVHENLVCKKPELLFTSERPYFTTINLTV